MSSDPVAYPLIELAWRQSVAAFWAVAWPGWLVSGFGLAMIAMAWTNIANLHGIGLVQVATHLAFLLFQLFLIPHLVSKRFRTFTISVIRDDGNVTRSLNGRDVLQVWARLVWPQALFTASLLALGAWASARGLDDLLRGLNGLFPVLRFLVVGPWAVSYAVRARYSGFRLQTNGLRYI